MNDNWRGWKNGKYDNRYRGVRRHSGKKNYWKPIAIILPIFLLIIFTIIMPNPQINNWINVIVSKATSIVKSFYQNPSPQSDSPTTTNIPNTPTTSTSQPTTSNSPSTRSNPSVYPSYANPSYACGGGPCPTPKPSTPTPPTTPEPITSTDQNSQQIDNNWGHSFMSDVNSGRKSLGISAFVEDPALDSMANTRFNTMVTHYQISHYGAESYNMGEVVFYPDGFSPEDYITNIQQTATLHWQLLMDPSLSNYGFYVGTGPIIEIVNGCSVSEIPGPNIDVVQYFQQHGCQTEVASGTWLVIDMN